MMPLFVYHLIFSYYYLLSFPLYFHTPSLFIYFHSDIHIRTIHSKHYYTMHKKSPLLLFISGGVCCLLYLFAFHTLYYRIILLKVSLSYQDYESLYISSQLDQLNFSVNNIVYLFAYNHFQRHIMRLLLPNYQHQINRYNH